MSLTSMAKKATLNASSRHDSSTFSNLDIQCEQLHLDLAIDFEKKIFKGSCTHFVSVQTDSCTHAVFDSSNLHVEKAYVNDEEMEFHFGERVAALGKKLSVSLPADLKKGASLAIKFIYSTDPNASAIQWLDPISTKGGKYPYVFTQSQAIHARSMFPCVDSPGVKVTYTANISAPSWCTVLMSALQQDSPSNSPSDDNRVFRWTQPVPVSSYLIAIAAGNLESREISNRVKVWSEPEVVDAAAFEFSETEDFLQAAEALTCEYLWTRYDVLCLPPSFPYGGMENPCLTFATPTLLAGDKSLADVIAHEIAHSWTGNLVTNHTWEHFWLNEGWTVWLERKIMARVKKDVEVLKLSAQGGWTHLRDDVDRMEGGSFTSLVWPLTEGQDPDDAFSSVPYEKGFNLLYYLESIVGAESFEAFAKAYIAKFKFGTVTSMDFKDFFLEYFSDAKIKLRRRIETIDWDTLFYGAGMPTHAVPDFSNSLSAVAEKQARLVIDFARDNATATSPPKVPDSLIDIANWSTQQRTTFLDLLLESAEPAPKGSGPFSIPVLMALDNRFNLTKSNNAEVKFRWQMLCIKSDAPWIVPHVVNFITSQGRMKYVRPLCRCMKASHIGTETVLETFALHKNMYHPIARKMVAYDLGVPDEETETNAADGRGEAESDGVEAGALEVSAADSASQDATASISASVWKPEIEAGTVAAVGGEGEGKKSGGNNVDEVIDTGIPRSFMPSKPKRAERKPTIDFPILIAISVFFLSTAGLLVILRSRK